MISLIAHTDTFRSRIPNRVLSFVAIQMMDPINVSIARYTSPNDAQAWLESTINQPVSCIPMLTLKPV
jgi:hypothetical protein